MWPVTQFLIECLDPRGEWHAARRLVDRLPDRNRNKAFRRVYAPLEQGVCDRPLAQRFETTLPAHRAGLRQALAATRAQQADRRPHEADAAFQPHLRLVGT